MGTCQVGIEHGGLSSSTELTQFMGRVRAKNGSIFVIGKEEDEAKLTKQFNARQRFKEGLFLAIEQQENNEITKDKTQRRFLTNDAIHVLTNWFRQNCDQELNIDVKVSQASYPKSRSFVGTVTFPKGFGMPSIVHGEAGPTHDSARRAAAYKACLTMLRQNVATPDELTGPSFLIIQSAREKRAAASEDFEGDLKEEAVFGTFEGKNCARADGSSVCGSSGSSDGAIYNPIGKLHELCQKSKDDSLKFEVIETRGEDHRPLFRWKCALVHDGHPFEESGERCSKKKEAKSSAAVAVVRRLRTEGYDVP